MSVFVGVHFSVASWHRFRVKMQMFILADM